MNYGHRLEFGTFITPLAEPPEAAVALARLSEELGYDLVTVQDHPYQARYMETWTLLAWIAGQTSRIRLAGNVLNAPLRPPAVLARATASLDLLSGGRLDLALGAGAFLEAAARMGGKRLTAGESVAALSEAIDIIRGLWQAGDRRAFSLAGDYYQVTAAQPGPVPAHDIPIWIGAYKPRMLQLVGQKADGWLPSWPYLTPDGLRSGNQIIDEAARDAGRNPREIRRLLNITGTFAPESGGFLVGPSPQWVADLLPLIVEEGVGTLILMSDDAATIQEFAESVIPVLREEVDRALPGAFSGARIRRAAVRARRRLGIAYESVPPSLAEAAVEPGDLGFARVRSNYLRGGSPGIVLLPRNVGEVVEALAFARDHPNVPLGVRSGGHGVSGRSTNDGGIVIDLAHLNAVEVLDPATRLVRVGPGARWMDVAAVLQPYGWALTSGDYGGVGVGGLATAAGVGFLARKFGLTIDHLQAVEIVLADGSVVRASSDTNPDLFWAVRGAGANFGIVTSFEFIVDAVGQVGWGQLVFDASDTAGFLETWGVAVEAAPRELTCELIMGPPRRDQPVIAQVLAMVASDDPEVIVGALQPIAEIAPLYDASVVIAPYASVMANAAEGYHAGQGEPVVHSALIQHITPAFAQAAARLIQSGTTYFFQVRAVGGAVSDVPPDATAYADRSANFQVNAFGASRRRFDEYWEPLREQASGMYLSFETDRSIERLFDAFPPPTLARLRALKARYDPDNLFRDNFNIAPRAGAD